MKLANSFSVFSHLLNFIIIIYFITFLLKIESVTTFDIVISFIGLFVSVLANIISVVEGANKKN
jgi:hypothetical protein